MSTGVLYQTRENKKNVKLTVKYDMDWQKRSYGRRYDSSNRHALIIGGRIKRIVGIDLYSKACHRCDAAGGKGEEVEEHEFPNKF